MNYAIILAGGVGSRFWPLSRRLLPKQFLRIIGNNTFFEATIRRILPVIPGDNIFIVTNRGYLKEIKKESGKFGIPARNIILEPKPLNTLPAISLCARLIALKDSQANLLVLPSDHYIKDDKSFKQAVMKAFNFSLKGFICLMGIKPDSPCTGYGYIKTGKRIEDGISYVDSFKEKPASGIAKRIFRNKDIFWNAGIFCFKAEIILREINRYAPKLYIQILKIKHKRDILKVWHKIRPVSMDYGLLEKTRSLILVAAKFYWRDLGSWDTLCEVLSKDKEDNIILSECVNLDSNNIFVCSSGPGRLVAAVGLENLIIVDTSDALLVCKRSKSQDVKRVVELLKRARKECV